MMNANEYCLSKDSKWKTVHKNNICYNFEKKSWAVLTDEGKEFLNFLGKGERELNNEEKEIVKKLQEIGVVEKKSLNPFLKEKSQLRVAYVHVCYSCNLKCPTCYSYDQKRENGIMLDTKQMKKVFYILAKTGVEEVVISGGEPFTRKDLPELIEYCKNTLKIKKIIIISNGTLLNDELIKRIKGNVDKIAVSIDGYDEQTNSYLRGEGSFKVAISGLRKLVQNGIPNNIISTIHKKNVDMIEKYLEFAKKENTYITFSIFTPTGAGKINEEELTIGEKELGILGEKIALFPEKIQISDTPFIKGFSVKESCGIGERLISIQANGDIFPCHILMDDKMKIGNILENNLEKILTESSICKEIRNIGVEKIEGCNSCEYNIFCAGGCKANAYHKTGKLNSCDPHCNLNKMYFKNVFDNLEINQ